jgi:hypothetical protein
MRLFFRATDRVLRTGEKIAAWAKVTRSAGQVEWAMVKRAATVGGPATLSVQGVSIENGSATGITEQANCFVTNHVVHSGIVVVARSFGATVARGAAGIGANAMAPTLCKEVTKSVMGGSRSSNGRSSMIWCSGGLSGGTGESSNIPSCWPCCLEMEEGMLGISSELA